MLLFSTKSFVVEGVTVFPDHADPNFFWYLPAPVALAPMPGSDEPQFLLIEYAPDVAATGVKGVGFLNVTTALRVPDDVQQEIKGQIRARFPAADNPQLGPVPFDEGSVQIVALDMQGGGGTSNTTPPGAFEAVEHILGASSPELFGDNNALFALTLSEDGATILEAAFANGMAPVGAIYSMKFTGVRPALDVKITADLKRCYDSFSIGLEAKVYWVSAGLDATFEKLRQDGAIHVEVVNLAGDAETLQAEQAAMNLFKDQIMSTWFQPSLSPTTAAAADANSVPVMSTGAAGSSGTAAGQQQGGAHPPATGMGSGAGSGLGGMGGALGGAMGGALGGSHPPVTGGAQPPVAGSVHPPATGIPAAGGMGGGLGSALGSALGGGIGGLHPPSPGQPAAPAAGTVGMASATAPTVVAPPPAPGVAGAVPAGGAPPAAAHPAIPSAAAGAGAGVHPPATAPGGARSPAGGGPALPGAIAQAANAASAASSAASPFGVSLKLKIVHQDELKTVTYEYNRMDAVQRVYAPQGYFGLLLASVNKSKHFLKVDGVDPFFERFTVNVAPPHDFAGIGLQTAHAALDYGDPAAPDRVKHGEFVFDAQHNTPQDWSVFEGAIRATEYRYTADYSFDPGSGWDGEHDRYQLPTVTTENRQLVLDPSAFLGFLDVAVQPGRIDADQIDRIDVAMTYAAPNGWTSKAVFTLHPGATVQNWKVRISDRRDVPVTENPVTTISAFTYYWEPTYFLKSGTVVHAGQSPDDKRQRTTTARAVIVDDPFVGALDVTLQPVFDAAHVKLALVEIRYADPSGYGIEKLEQFAAGAPPVPVHIPLLDAGATQFSYRITLVDPANNRTQGQFVTTSDTLVLIGA